MSRYLVALLSLFALGLAACVPEDPCRCVEEDGGGLFELDAFIPPDAGAADVHLDFDAAPAVDATRDAGPDAPWASLEVTPAILDFGSPCGDSAYDFTVRNMGTASTGRLAVEVTGSPFVLVGTDCVPGLGPGASCVVEVRAEFDWAPGSRGGVLRVHGEGVEASAALSVSFPSCDLILWGGPPIDFGSVAVGERSEARRATFRSTMLVVSEPIRIALSGRDSGDFEVVPSPDSCEDLALGSLQSCEVLVRFAPTARGARSAALRVVPMGAFGVGLAGKGE